jgi:uncharacterized protein (DUF2141 family)
LHKLILSQLITFFILISQLSFAQPVELFDSNVEIGNIIVIISGFENSNGECWFAIDNSEGIYESEDSVYIGKILPIINNKVVITIDSLQYGNYAIRVFHDENSNGEVDTNFLGIPTEDYGYSNNASAWFGPPSWERAMFKLNQKEMRLEISVD